MKIIRPTTLLMCLALFLLPGMVAFGKEPTNHEPVDAPQSILFVGNSLKARCWSSWQAPQVSGMRS